MCEYDAWDKPRRWNAMGTTPNRLPFCPSYEQTIRL